MSNPATSASSSEPQLPRCGIKKMQYITGSKQDNIRFYYAKIEVSLTVVRKRVTFVD